MIYFFLNITDLISQFGTRFSKINSAKISSGKISFLKYYSIIVDKELRNILVSDFLIEKRNAKKIVRARTTSMKKIK